MIICRCFNKCLGICRRSRRDQNPKSPVLPFTQPPPGPDDVPDVVHPESPTTPIPPPPRDSEVVRTPKPGPSSKPTRMARRGRVSKRGGVTKPGQAAKPKPGQEPKPKPGQAPKPKPGKAPEAGDSEGNISDEGYPPLPPSREGSRTGITPEMSDIDINEPRDIDDIDDIDMPDAEAGDELFSYPRTPPRGQTPLPQDDDAGHGDTSSGELLYFGSRSSRAVIPMRPPPDEPSSSGFSNDEVDELLYPTPTEEKLATYRRKGAELVAWLEDPNEPGCYVAPATVTLDDMLNNFQEDYRFGVGQSVFQDVDDIFDGGEPETMGLTIQNNRYRRVTLSSKVNDEEILRENARDRMSNSFAHMIGPGIIMALSIYRYDCVQWNEIARALYVADHPITTLRHIMYSCVVNDETGPYIRRIAYPRHDRIFDSAERDPPLILERGTREYEELLGTKLGKATAILLISSLPRGTIRISRAVIWNYHTRLELRFQFEPIPDNERLNPEDQPATAECD
ncbi:hypothetical protein N7465_003573 [Penicillium sp. CMV-2018d]|nr:hypothetical protein N7465_003573 [Penicillium sp. CMV-2018d]